MHSKLKNESSLYLKQHKDNHACLLPIYLAKELIKIQS